jgi:hypothetical protein
LDGAPTAVTRKEVWASQLSHVNGIKYHAGAMYVTILSPLLMGQFARVPLRADGNGGEAESCTSAGLRCSMLSNTCGAAVHG